jgi:hypothetical protein
MFKIHLKTSCHITVSLLLLLCLSACNLFQKDEVSLTATEVLDRTRHCIDPDRELNNVESFKFKGTKKFTTKSCGTKYIESAYFFKAPHSYKIVCYLFTDRIASKTNDVNYVSCNNGKFAWKFAKSKDNNINSFHIVDNLDISTKEFKDTFNDMALGIFREPTRLLLFPETIVYNNVKCYKLYLSFKDTDYINENAVHKIVETQYYIDSKNYKIRQLKTLTDNEIITDKIKYKKFCDLNLPYKYQRTYNNAPLPYKKVQIELSDFELKTKLDHNFFDLPPKSSEVWNYLNK